MSDDKVYKDGDIVWVKLGNNWWPGEVIGNEEHLPEGLNQLKKKPYCVVKFFNEDAYEYPKTEKQVYPFQCPKKDEFIKKGLALYNAKNAFMEKFPKDVKYAESRTKLSPVKLSIPFINDRSGSIVKAVMSHGQIRKSTDYYEIGQAGIVSSHSYSSREQSLLQNDSMTTIININTPNRTSFGSTSSILTPTALTRTPLASSSASITPNNASTNANCQYRCNMCDFTTMRQNVLIMHRKSHSSGSTGVPYARSKLSLVKPKTSDSIIVSSTNDVELNVSEISTKPVEILSTPLSTKNVKNEETIKEEIKTLEESATELLTLKRSCKKLNASPANATKRTTRATCSTPQPTMDAVSVTEVSSVPNDNDEDVVSDSKTLSPAVDDVKHTEKIRERLLADWSDEEKDEALHLMASSANTNTLQLPTTSSKSYSRLLSPTIVPAAALQGDGLMVGSVTQSSENSTKPMQRIRNIPKKDRLREFEQASEALEATDTKIDATEIKSTSDDVIEKTTNIASPKNLTEKQKTRSRSRAEVIVKENELSVVTSTFSCFDFQEDEEEAESDVLKSIAKFKKKYYSPEKEKKEKDEREQKQKAMQRDLELSAEIDNLLESTTVVTELKTDTVPVKGLPIKERGKRIFKSRNRSRIEDDELDVATEQQTQIVQDTLIEETISKSERKVCVKSKHEEGHRTPQKEMSPVNGKAAEHEAFKRVTANDETTATTTTTEASQQRHTTRKTHNNRIMQQFIEEEEASIPFIRHSPVELYSCDMTTTDAAATLVRDRRSKTNTPVNFLIATRDEVVNGNSNVSGGGGGGSRASSRNFNAPPLTPTDETSSFGISEAAEFGSPASSLDEERLLTPRETPSLSEFEIDKETCDYNEISQEEKFGNEQNDDDEIESPQHEALSGNELDDSFEEKTRLKRLRTPKKNINEIKVTKSEESIKSKTEQNLRQKLLDIVQRDRSSPKRLTHHKQTDQINEEVQATNLIEANTYTAERVATLVEKEIITTAPTSTAMLEAESETKKPTHRKTRATRSQTPIRDRQVDTPTSNASIESADATSKDRKRSRKAKKNKQKLDLKTTVKRPNHNDEKLATESTNNLKTLKVTNKAEENATSDITNFTSLITKEDKQQKKDAKTLENYPQESTKVDNLEKCQADEMLTGNATESKLKHHIKSAKTELVSEKSSSALDVTGNEKLEGNKTQQFSTVEQLKINNGNTKQTKETIIPKKSISANYSATKDDSSAEKQQKNKEQVKKDQVLNIETSNRQQTKTPPLDKEKNHQHNKSTDDSALNSAATRKRHSDSSEKSQNHKTKQLEANEVVSNVQNTEQELSNKELTKATHTEENIKEKEETLEKSRALSPKKQKSNSSEKKSTVTKSEEAKKLKDSSTSSTSPTIEKVRINVDVAHPLSTQIAGILAASGNNCSTNQSTKSSSSNHKIISSLKRKLSPETISKTNDGDNDAVVAHMQSLCPQVKITRKERLIEPIVDTTIIPDKLLATPKKSLSPNAKATTTTTDISQMPILISNEASASPPALVSSNLWQTELIQPPSEQQHTPPHKKIGFDPRGQKYVVLNTTEQISTPTSPNDNGGTLSSSLSQKSPAGMTGGRKQAGNTLAIPSNITVKQHQTHKFAEALAMADSVLGPITKPTKRRSSQSVSNSNTTKTGSTNTNRRFSSTTATTTTTSETKAAPPPAKLKKQILSGEERSKSNSPSKMQSGSCGSGSSSSSPISKSWSQTHRQAMKQKKSETSSEDATIIVTEAITITTTTTPLTSPVLTPSSATLTAVAEETQTVVEAELNSTAKITAVPIQPIPGYAETFMLCMLVDNMYKPINNIPHYLNTDLNQLVPVPPEAYKGMLPELVVEQPPSVDIENGAATGVNASLTTTTPSSKLTSIVSTREGGETIIETASPDADDSVHRIGLQIDESALIGHTDCAAIAVETDAVETSTDNAIVLNLENQQIILDAATFEQLLANPDANTQLITDDGTEFVLTREVLAALKAQHDDQNAELLAVPADQQHHMQDQLIASETVSSADLLSVALTNTEFYGGEMLQIETSLGVAGSAVDAAGLHLLASDGSIVFQAPQLPHAHLTPPITAHTSETNAVLNQTPIMSTLEKPSTAHKAGVDSPTAVAVVEGNLMVGTRPNLDDSLAVIGVTTQSSSVPSSLELPITITNPAIAPKVTMAGTSHAAGPDLVQFQPPRSVATASLAANVDVTNVSHIYDDDNIT